jgi:hypothetical protein
MRKALEAEKKQLSIWRTINITHADGSTPVDEINL